MNPQSLKPPIVGDKKYFMSIVEKAAAYAKKVHKETNHLYGGEPYVVHLRMVVRVAKRFIHLVPEYFQPKVLAAAWCHDVIEDCRQTYNDVKKVIGIEAADIVYALTNEKGKTRKERANGKYYSGIMHTPYATFVKCADRIANMEYSIMMESPMADMYANESEIFESNLYEKEFEEMFQRLRFLKEEISPTEPTDKQIERMNEQ